MLRGDIQLLSTTFAFMQCAHGEVLVVTMTMVTNIKNIKHSIAHIKYMICVNEHRKNLINHYHLSFTQYAHRFNVHILIFSRGEIRAVLWITTRCFIVDCFSKYPESYLLKGWTAESFVNQLKYIFACQVSPDDA